MSRPRPEDALTLLLDFERQAWACDFHANPAFSHARQTTRAFRGERMVDAYRQEPDPRVWAAKLRAALELPLVDFKKLLNEEHPLVLQEIQKDDDWIMGPGERGDTRPIVKATFFRRCASNLFADVLDATSHTILSDDAIAYRRGRPDVIHRTLRRVAAAVHGGKRFWVKLDIRNFFGSVPWKEVESALCRADYPADFIARVMALVTTTTVRRDAGSWISVANNAGTQAGLRESSTLANIFLASLDGEIQKRFGGRIVYLRYSDDILIVANSAADAAAAANLVRAWMTAHGLTLKGISKRSTRSLVHNVSKRRLEFLGAEIDPRGTVRIPKPKLESFAAKLRYMARHRVSLGPVIGFSAYAPGGVPLLAYDDDDLRSVIDGFANPWRDLDAPNLQPSLGDLLLGLDLCPPATEAGTSWVAVVNATCRALTRSTRSGGPPLDDEEERRSSLPLDERDIRALLAECPFTNRDSNYGGASAHDDRSRQQGPDDVVVRGTGEVRAEGRDVTESEAPGGGNEDAPEGAHSLCGRELRLDYGRVERGSPPVLVRGASLSLGREPGGMEMLDDGDDGGLSLSLSGDHGNDVWCSSRCSSSGLFPVPPDGPSSQNRGEDLNGYGREAAGGSSSALADRSPRRALKTRHVAVDHRALRGEGLVLVGTFIDGDDGELVIRRRRARRHESFVIDVITEELVRAAREGAAVLVVSLSSAWLPKLVVQDGRAIRTVTLADRVERLHEQVVRGSVHLVIHGPSQTPESLRNRLDDAVVAAGQTMARSRPRFPNMHG